MEYIIISILTISVFTYIVYMLANKLLAIQMHIKFLVLCAFCAFSISLILPRMFVGFAGLTGTLCIIILFGLISSYFIARYYQSELEKTSLERTLVATLMEIPETMEPDEADKLDVIQITSPISNLENIVDTMPDPTEILETITETETEIETEVHDYFYPVQYREKIWKVLTVETAVQLPLLKRLPVMVEVEVKDYLYPIEYKEGIIAGFLEKLSTINRKEESEELVEDVIKNSEEAEVVNDLMDVKNNESNVEQQEISQSQESQSMDVSDSNLIPEATVVEELYPSSTDLDVLMDLAFLQKEQRKFLQALKTFRRALFLYPDNEVSPFLVIEIGTILKNTGCYNEAIQVFTEGRLLPGVINNKSLEQEFINNVAYLRIVKNVLIKSSLEFTPLSQIPSHIATEIDDEFCEWRSQS